MPSLFGSGTTNSIYLKFGVELGFKKFLKPISKNQIVPEEIIDQIIVLPKKESQVMSDTNTIQPNILLEEKFLILE